MTSWRVVAVAHATDLGVADAAEALAAAHDLGFELLVVGGEPLTRSRWPHLTRIMVTEVDRQVADPAGMAAIAAAALGTLTQATLLIVDANPFGQDCAAALAGSLGAELLGQPSRLAFQGRALQVQRIAYGGRIRIDQRHTSGVCVAALRPPTPVEADVPLPPQEMVGPTACPATGLTIEELALPDRKTPLEGASIIVSGGRGIDAAGFALLDQIADCIDGALGGSLPAVDAGLVPVSRQIGQSGKFVTPRIYLAVGLSGTPQHLAGIGAATRIIAVNADPTAPIFAYAEAGCVADASALLPELVMLLRR